MEALGIDLRWFLFQLGNFVILFILLSVLLHKPLQKLLENRNKEIKEGLANAERMKLALAETEQRQQETLEQAQKEARRLIEETRTQAKELETRLQQDAQEKADKLLARTQDEIASERDQLRSELRGELAAMVITATEKVLDEKIDDTEKKKQVEKLVHDLEKEKK